MFREKFGRRKFIEEASSAAAAGDYFFWDPEILQQVDKNYEKGPYFEAGVFHDAFT